MKRTWEVTFGNPSKEVTYTVTVDAPDEQSAIIEARLDATHFGASNKVSSIREIRRPAPLGSYREQMIDAGRGHLLGGKD